jgi:prepilin-type N-terminal cleavage/methylation domain-containing protein
MSNKGFSLIELMATLSIAAIVVAAGAPAMKSMVENNARPSEANRLLGALRYARGEAIKRRMTVTLRTNGTSGSWAEGWEIYTNTLFDSDCNITDERGYTAFSNTCTNAELRSDSEVSPSIRITGDSTTNTFISFDKSGMLLPKPPTSTAAATARFVICNHDVDSVGVSINIVRTGRTSTKEVDSGNCTP